MTPEWDARIREALCENFPADYATFSRTRAWHGSAPAFSLVIAGNDEIAAHVGVVDRVISVDNVQFRTAGIQNVFVNPTYRGKGMSRAILKSAMEESKKRAFDIGLLFCLPTLGPLYASSGWKDVGARKMLYRDDTSGKTSIPEKNTAMFFPLHKTLTDVFTINLEGPDW